MNFEQIDFKQINFEQTLKEIFNDKVMQPWSGKIPFIVD